MSGYLFLFQLQGAIGKSRHGATSSHQFVDGDTQSPFLALLENKEDEDKENRGNSYRNKSVIESSDDDFDHCEFFSD